MTRRRRAAEKPKTPLCVFLCASASPRQASRVEVRVADVNALASKIRLLLMDVDGVLTDGKLYNVPAPDGSMAETKGFDSQDGIALQWLAKLGIVTGLISGRVSPATEERAKQCKFKYVYQGHTEKIPILDAILADSGIPAAEV